MHPVDVINSFLLENQMMEEKLHQLFAADNFKTPILNREYYYLAEEISKIPDFTETAEALLTSEKPRKINPQSILRIWISISNSLDKLAPAFGSELSKQLKQLFQTLCQQYADKKFTSSQYITERLHMLLCGESFELLLPLTNGWGKNLENIVVYKKNADATFDIRLFYAKKGCWQEQGGEYAIDFERLLPMRYYSKIPYEDLLGDDNNKPSQIHAQTLLKAIENPTSNEKTLSSAFNALNGYLKEPVEQFRLIKAEHTHSLKAITAFIFSFISEKSNPDDCVDQYKAFMCITRLVLSIAIMKSFANKDINFHCQTGLLSEATITTARHVSKHRNNPLLKHLYEAAVGTLLQLKDKAEQLIYQPIPLDYSVKAREIPENQANLVKKALHENENLVKAAEPAIIIERFNKDFSLIGKPPSDCKTFISWLMTCDEKITILQRSYPDLTLTILNDLIDLLEMPCQNSIWMRLSLEDCEKSLKILNDFSELLVKTAFQQSVRFSLEVQNRGAYLLLIGYALAERLEVKKILYRFKPALKGYKKLSVSPFFQVKPYTEWLKRQDILQFIQTYEIGRTETLTFVNKEKLPFDQTADGIFAYAFLMEYPEINSAIKHHVGEIRQNRGLERYHNIISEQWLLAKLLNMKIQGDIEIKLDLQKSNLLPIACLMQMAAHIHLLSNQRAIYQTGYENKVTFQEGLGFDFSYAKKQKNRFDFQNSNANLGMAINPNQRNLFHREKWLRNQNETLHCFTSNDQEKMDAMFIFEEAASEPSIKVPQLLSQMKFQLAHLENPQLRNFFEKYLFRTFVSKEGAEIFFAKNEMIENSQLFNHLLHKLLEASTSFTKDLENGKINFQTESTLNLVYQMYIMAVGIPCKSVLTSLENFLATTSEQLKAGLEKIQENQHLIRSKMLMFLLKILELHAAESVKWEFYFKWGTKFQELLEQKEVDLNAETKFWWCQMRLKMAQYFQVFEEKDFQAAAELIDKENFDLLAMSYGKGRWQQIPLNIRKHPEFIRLFSDRIQFWKVDEENQCITFSDPFSGKYRVTNDNKFPLTLYRWIDGIWHLYIPNDQIETHLHIPKSIRQESIWWINPEKGNFKAYGYYKCDPKKIWMERNKEGFIFFKDGKQKGLRLELVENEVKSLSDLEVNTGAFGLHYYAYQPRYLKDHLMPYRDLLVFPNIRMPHGGELIFERYDHEFCEQGNLERQLGLCLFAPTILKPKSTPIRLYGIQLKKKNSEGITEQENTLMLLPFQRHVSDPHSHLIHTLSPKMTVELPSLLNSIDVVEMPVNSQGFCPKTMMETFFAAYLSLIGKDYLEALKFLKNVRPNYRLEKKDRQILQWLINCKEDAHDHSSQAAAIKLLAYKIWGEQGIPIGTEINANEFLSDSLESIYLQYLNHSASVPPLLKIPLDIELWILDKGFALFPYAKCNQKLWETRKDNLLKGEKIAQLFKLPVLERLSLFDKWNHLTIPAKQTEFEMPYALIEGILYPTDHGLIPGKPYPFGAFGYHYQLLSSQVVDKKNKWELLYSLEAVEMPSFVQAALAKAFQQEKQAVGLPKIHHKSRLENIKIVSEWIKHLIKDCPVLANDKKIENLYLKESELNVEKQIENGHEVLPKKIQAILNETKKLLPYELITALKKVFADSVHSKKPFVEIESPFKNIEATDEMLFKELEWYQREWNEGILLQKQARQYAVPSPLEIEALQKILQTYTHEIHLENLQHEILKIINRKPIDPQMMLEARMDSIIERKVELDLDVALKSIFIADKDQKLLFLRKYNPYLLEDDVKILNTSLMNYLEWSISDQILGQIKTKMNGILKIVEEMDQKPWQDHPSVQEAWQEIGELLNPFDQYSDDPQTHLETLLFEHFCGFRIKEQQAKIFHLLCEKIFTNNPQESVFAVVFQLMMGEGKTSVILALLAKLATMHGQAPIFLAYHAQYASLKANLVPNQKKRLNQDVIDLDFNRADLADLKVLRYINDQFQFAKDNHQLILMKIGLLFILRLEFIHQIKAVNDPQNLDPLSWQRIHELAKILEFIGNKKKSLVLCDEIDSCLNILEEVNFPAGQSIDISRYSLDLIKQVYVTLLVNPGIANLLKLDTDDQALITKMKLCEKIFPDLVDHLINHFPPLSNLIPPKNYEQIRKSLKDYVLGKIDPRLNAGLNMSDEEKFLSSLKITEEHEEIKAKHHLAFLRHLVLLKEHNSESVKQSLHTVSLLKELCTQILPFTLSKSLKHRYGYSQGKVIPYLGVNTPNKTEFGNIYVTACYYFQMALQIGVDVERLKDYRDKLREASFYYSQLNFQSPERSPEAQHFKTLTGLELHQEWADKDLKKALDLLNKDPQRCADFFAEFASKYLRYHSLLQSCGPVSLGHLVGQMVGCSAVLWNKDSFAKSIADSCILQKGIEGRILVKFTQDLATKKSFLSVTSEANPQTILNTVLKKRARDTTPFLRGLIDASGMLKRYTNREVAEEILKFKPLEDQIDAVIFLDKIENDEFFSMLKRNAKKSLRLMSTQRKEIVKHGVPIDRIFVYFDELRSTGSDIPLKADAIVVSTFHPFSTTIRTGTQAFLRARNFFREQVVDTVIQKEALEGFDCYDEQSPESCLNAKNFFFTAIRNQSESKKIQLLRSALDQVTNSYCALIEKKLIQAFSKDNYENESASIEILHESEWLFFRSFSDDPITMFLDLKLEIAAFKVVENYAMQVDKRFKLSCSQYFEEKNLQQLAKSIDEILLWSRKNLTWKMTYSDLTTHLENQVQLEKQHENQLEINTETQTEIQKELQKYTLRIDAPIAKHLVWEPLQLIPQSFLDYKAPEIMTFRKLLKRLDYLAPYHQIFPKNFYLTENLARSHEVDLPVFHKAQKNIYHILLVKDGNTYRPLCIDYKEAAFWRNEIAKHHLQDCWLFDLEGHSLNDKKTLPEQAHSNLLQAQWWGHFFNGNASFLRAYPDLVQAELKNENYELKYRFLLLKASSNPLQTKILTIDPILAHNPLEAPVFHFNDKIEENEWLNGVRKKLNAEEINQLPFHFARFFSSEQIALIKRAGYFSYLPPEKFDEVLPEQIPLIPDYRLQYLCTPEQVAVVPPEKISCLKGIALKYISEKDLDKVNQEAIVDLSSDMQKKYQKIQIEKLGLKAFSKSIHPCVASIILPKCVEYLNDACLTQLTTPKQLACVPVKKYHLLKARQFHLLPSENWAALQLGDYKKYFEEMTISPAAQKLVQQINAEWVNEIDPRLAEFFNENQVRKIERPKPIKYLKSDQLIWLKPALSKYLEPDQVAALSSQHRHLIQTFEDSKMIKLLSRAALQELSPQQVTKIKDRETLLRINPASYPYLLSDQIALLQSEKIQDQEIIKHLTVNQIKGLEKHQILAFLPYLNEASLKSVDAQIIGEAIKLSTAVRQRLTPLQMQYFLYNQKNRKVNLARFFQEMSACQWRGLDEIFIETFFTQKAKRIVQCIPKYHVHLLPKGALLRWYDVDTQEKMIGDILIGLGSLLLYPLILLSGVIFTLFSLQKRASQQKILRQMVFSPLRFFNREKYYRLMSEIF